MIAQDRTLVLDRQSGAGMVETMVGILIGLLVVLIVYNLLSVAEGYRRTTTGAADAQITGILAQFVAGRDAGNGGNGISSATTDLINCSKDEAGNPDTSLRPIPVVITDGGAAGVSDSFVSWQSGSPHVVWSVEFHGVDTPAGGNIVVQSPNGFSTPAGVSLPTAATPYWVIAMANDGSGRCKLLQVTDASVPDPVTGEVTLTQLAAMQTTITYSGTAIPPARLVNLGPQGDAARIRYDVVGNQLRTTDCMLGCGALPAPNPIAQNIVLMKVQYGIDTSVPVDGTVDCWTPADAITCGDWSAANVQSTGFTQDNINRMIAVRIGVVVRSEEPDLHDDTLTAAGVGPIPARPAVVLFNCAANDATCQNRVVLPAAAPAVLGSGDCAPSVICDHWRYRTYETVIPLRNPIYTATLPTPP